VGTAMCFKDIMHFCILQLDDDIAWAMMYTHLHFRADAHRCAIYIDDIACDPNLN